MGSSEAIAILQSLLDQIQPWWTVIMLMSRFFGFCLLVFGFLQLGASSADIGQALRGGLSRGTGIDTPIKTLLVGFLLLSLPGVLDIFSMSLFGVNAPENVLSYIPAGNGDPLLKLMVQLSISIIAIIGLCGAVRGLNMIRQNGQGSSGEFWSALTHIAGGVAAINIVTVSHLVAAFMGPSAQSLVGNLLG